MEKIYDNAHKSVSKLLKQLTAKNAPYVSNQAKANPNGLGANATEVLNYIHSLPPAFNFPPETVRQYRQNPYEHSLTLGVDTRDIKIPAGSHSLDARVYRTTENQNTIQPALVYFHGGGFVLGDIESYDALLRLLCNLSRITVISVAYRLAPETRFPGAVEDVQAAMNWVFTEHATIAIDPKKVIIGGDSAGANLSLAYCQINKHKKENTPCLQLLIYPSTIGNDSSPSREQYTENLLLTAPLLRWFHSNYIDRENENDPRFNSMRAKDFKHLPPAFVITAGFDPLRDEGQMLVNAMTRDKVTVRHSCYTDMFHGFINFGVIPQAIAAVNECANVLRTVTNINRHTL